MGYQRAQRLACLAMVFGLGFGLVLTTALYSAGQPEAVAGPAPEPEAVEYATQAKPSEYSFLFSALARINGIPTRLVGGTRYRAGDGEYIDTILHRKVQFYLPDYAWLPVDATVGDVNYANRDDFFARSAADFFTISVAGGKSRYLRWNPYSYNTWQQGSEKAAEKSRVRLSGCPFLDLARHRGHPTLPL